MWEQFYYYADHNVMHTHTSGIMNKQKQDLCLCHLTTLQTFSWKQSTTHQPQGSNRCTVQWSVDQTCHSSSQPHATCRSYSLVSAVLGTGLWRSQGLRQGLKAAKVKVQGIEKDNKCSWLVKRSGCMSELDSNASVSVSHVITYYWSIGNVRADVTSPQCHHAQSSGMGTVSKEEL